MKIISRQHAREIGLLRYFTGKPCVNGHVDERQVSNATCFSCSRDKQKRFALEKRALWLEGTRRRNKKYRAKNRDKFRRLDAVYYKKRIDKKKQYNAKWNSANKERHRLTTLGWRAKNKEKLRSTKKMWNRANPERIRVYNRNSKVKRRSAIGKHTLCDIRKIIVAQKHRCAYCAISLKKTERHVDHIVPISKGGSNNKQNLQILCVPCNLAKQAKDPIDYAREIGRLL
jgi:5-methylcytosine-specific restriction endonuclease McrA